MIDKSKRSFFKRASSPFSLYIYPPYYEDKNKFLDCLDCETKDCLLACEEKIIVLQKGFPVIDFSKSGCTFCDKCAITCDKNVLKLENKKNKLNCELIINPKTCIAWNQTICFACQEICSEKAIDFKGLFNPIINEEKCTSCGFCIAVCPANSIEILREE